MKRKTKKTTTERRIWLR